MKKAFTLTLLLLAGLFTALHAQVSFTVSQKRVSPTEIDIVFTGHADAGWHVYSTNLPPGGPNAATFNVDKKQGVELVGGLRWVEEPSSLRFFFGRLEPTSNWQDKLVEKFRADFGESL